MEEKWLETLKKGKCIPEREVKILCEKVKELLFEESNILLLPAPIVVCGDIHGQFYDLLELFKTGGEIPESRYLFMGDYVDRGYCSVETLQLLLVYKLKYANYIFLLRGNHESRQVSFSYGFYEEILRKYGNSNCWKYFTDLFDYLPLGALIEGKIFCIHGGLSPNVSTVDQMRLLNRKMEIPHEGAFADLMWSDPEDIETWLLSNRGAGWLFGSKVVKEFNHLNNTDLISRSHQLVDEGFKFWFKDKTLVTIWSAPNYCYRMGNLASIMKVSSGLEKSFKVFKEVPDSGNSKIPKNVVPYFL